MLPAIFESSLRRSLHVARSGTRVTDVQDQRTGLGVLHGNQLGQQAPMAWSPLVGTLAWCFGFGLEMGNPWTTKPQGSKPSFLEGS